LHWLWSQKRREEAPEGKLKGKESDRNVASLALLIRAETSLWRKERRCKTGKKISVTKNQNLAQGRRRLLIYLKKEGNGTSCIAGAN